MDRSDLTERASLYSSTVRYEDLPEEVICSVKRSFRDWLGVAVAGCCTPGYRTLCDFNKSMYGNGEKTASVLLSRLRYPVDKAALINGTVSHALDYDDCHRELHGHPSSVLVSAILALGELCHASGEKAIAAYTAGAEVMFKLCGAIENTHYGKGWHATGTGGCVGAAAACANLMDFSMEDTVNAIGIAASLSSGIRANFGSMMKPFHAGWAAQNAVLSVLMTKAGVRASRAVLEKNSGFVRCFSEESVEAVADRFDELGVRYSILDPGLKYKPYPCCAGTHPPIGALQKLMEREADIKDSNKVSRILCRVQPWQNTTLIYPDPQTGLQGKFSLQYTVARMWADHHVGLGDFSDEAVMEQHVRRLMPKVVMLVTGSVEEYNAFPTVEVFMEDGRYFKEKIIFPLGDARNPLSEQQHIDKFNSCVKNVISEASAERLLKITDCLESLEDVGCIIPAAGVLDF